MKIGEIAQQTGTPTSTIRYYERVGILPKPGRVSGQRIYTAEVVESLEAITIAQDLGFTLEEIKVIFRTFQMDENPSETCQTMTQQKLDELDQLIAKAQRMKQILEHGGKLTNVSRGAMH